MKFPMWRWALCLCLIVTAAPMAAVQAQTQELHLLRTVTGNITAAQPIESWAFQAQTGARISARVFAISGDLVPHFSLVDASGEIHITSFNGEYRTAFIEDVTIPETGVYTLRVSAAPEFMSTHGSYELTLIPGFSHVSLEDGFEGRGSLRNWRLENAFAVTGGGRLQLDLRGEETIAWTETDGLDPLRDYYAQVDVSLDRAGEYWEVGLISRGTGQGSDLTGYVFALNSRGQWRFSKSLASTQTTIRGWRKLNQMPQPPFTLGMLAQGEQFTFYLNGLAVAEVEDNTFSDAGFIGVMIGTGKAPSSLVTANFDNLVVTTAEQSLERSNPSSPIMPPAQIKAWDQSSDAVLAELRTMGLIPPTHESGFGILDAFVTNTLASGIVFTPLARGAQFADMIYAADVIWETTTENAGCAFKLRAPTAKIFTFVYLDRKGGVGARQEDSDQVKLSVYDVFPTVRRDNLATNRVLILAFGNGLAVYVNGERVIHANADRVRGTVSVAAYNYERADTFCRFSNVWLRAFDRPE
ncbi:hypothetical protein ANRL4_03487 [Anaerolineae bacterium]|nr:hypothetical protein ANRL4_03487 [Anaerolineae bacterium]